MGSRNRGMGYGNEPEMPGYMYVLDRSSLDTSSNCLCFDYFDSCIPEHFAAGKLLGQNLSTQVAPNSIAYIQ
jgi:hypothetical protein